MVVVGAASGAPYWWGNGLLAVLLVRTCADLRPLQEALGEEDLVVPLRDPHRGQEDRLRPAHRRVGLDRLAFEDVDRGRRGGLGLQADRLVDGAALPAGEDELDAGRRRVLA